MMVICRDKWACQGLRDRVLRINYRGRVVDDDHESRGVGGLFETILRVRQYPGYRKTAAGAFGMKKIEIHEENCYKASIGGCQIGILECNR